MSWVQGVARGLLALVIGVLPSAILIVGGTKLVVLLFERGLDPLVSIGLITLCVVTAVLLFERMCNIGLRVAFGDDKRS